MSLTLILSPSGFGPHYFFFHLNAGLKKGFAIERHLAAIISKYTRKKSTFSNPNGLCMIRMNRTGKVAKKGG